MPNPETTPSLAEAEICLHIFYYLQQLETSTKAQDKTKLVRKISKLKDELQACPEFKTFLSDLSPLINRSGDVKPHLSQQAINYLPKLPNEQKFDDTQELSQINQLSNQYQKASNKEKGARGVAIFSLLFMFAELIYTLCTDPHLNEDYSKNMASVTIAACLSLTIFCAGYGSRKREEMNDTVESFGHRYGFFTNSAENTPQYSPPLRITHTYDTFDVV